MLYLFCSILMTYNMKKLYALASIALLATGFTSCKKCADCTGRLTELYQFNSGEQVTVVEGSATYGSTTYNVGQSFSIKYDTSFFANGLRYEGDAKVATTVEICGKSHVLDANKDDYTANGWSCADK